MVAKCSFCHNLTEATKQKLIFKTHVLEREFSVRGNLRVLPCRVMMVFVVYKLATPN